MRLQRTLSAAGVCLAIAAAALGGEGNLLRNGRFQDDWLSLLPETKNHHWCYSSEFYHRRDYNPDSWLCKGSWRWDNADAAPGARRLVLAGPSAELTQRVNWIAVHDERKLEGFPDAGGFPALAPQRSDRPLALVRDLTLRVKLAGHDLPANAGQIEVGYCLPAPVDSSTPLNMTTPPVGAATADLPSGSFDAKWLEIKLSGADWLAALEKTPAAKDAAPAVDKSGTLLPVSVSVTIRYRGATGRVELLAAELAETAASSAPNLLGNGGFETLDADGYPTGWEKPAKYRYFPPGRYYIFNTWHNAGFDNRGPVFADSLVLRAGRHSLAMIVAQGDEKSVSSAPIALNQTEPRLVEVSAWVKTDLLATLQIDAVDDAGQRLDGFNFIHKAPVSIGTDEWRLVRQVFRPRAPLKSIRLMLCARGVNGYTLDDTGPQPQNNVVGAIWWDDVRVFEPEATAAELAARKISAAPAATSQSGVHLAELNFDERLLGDNSLSATIVNPGAAGAFQLAWEHENAGGEKFRAVTDPVNVPAGGTAPARLTYKLSQPGAPYSHLVGRLSLLENKKIVASSDYWLSTWTTPIDLELGALYLEPEARQLVRINLGYSAAAMVKIASVRLELLRRGTRESLKKWEIPAAPAAIAAQRERIHVDLREDFTNLLLTELDVSSLPLLKFDEPSRNWLIRGTVIGTDGQPRGATLSAPFCRLAHEPPQPAITSVAIKGDLLFVNDQPWLPFGAVYGHVPVASGPADPGAGKYRDLHNLPAWSLYDRFTAEPYNRKHNDFNCMRYVAGSLTDPKVLEKRWQEDNLYCSSAFVAPDAPFSVEQLQSKAGGADKLAAAFENVKNGPMIVSSAVGIEEAFGLFHQATSEQLAGLKQAAQLTREKTGKPVMVGHGGYWNRLEFERVPFFDIYDPETEPFFPANLHTDLAPLVKGQNKVIWLRPQMYEDVPYERWRFHVLVELMRGCRGWQIAHGPGDASLFRGLHGEIEMLKPVVAASAAGPRVEIKPWLEHFSRRVGDKLTIIAASTHGLPLGQWRDGGPETPEGAPSRVTEATHELRDEANAYAIGARPDTGPAIHGIQNLPEARVWAAGSVLTQQGRWDESAPPKNLVLLVKADGRWTSAAKWGVFDAAPLRSDPKLAYWFLSSFYRHSKGFLGWDTKLVPNALEYIPARPVAMGALPKPGDWFDLRVSLKEIGAADKLIDGVAWLHEGGRVCWGETTLVDAHGELVLGSRIGLAPAALKEVHIDVAGVKPDQTVRVLLEDRELTSVDGGFVDDFSGEDLYQRFGGGRGVGYGDTPVAVHIYELTSPK